MIQDHTPGRHPLPRQEQKKNNGVIHCIVMIGIAFALPEMGSLVTIMFKNSKVHATDLFLCPWFKYEMKDYWYFIFVGQDLKDILLIVVLLKLAAKYSDSLFNIGIVFLAYSIIDFGMFWWNFSTYVFAYWCILWFCLVLSVSLINRFKPEKLAQIRSIF